MFKIAKQNLKKKYPPPKEKGNIIKLKKKEEFRLFKLLRLPPPKNLTSGSFLYKESHVPGIHECQQPSQSFLVHL